MANFYVPLLVLPRSAKSGYLCPVSRILSEVAQSGAEASKAGLPRSPQYFSKVSSPACRRPWSMSLRAPKMCRGSYRCAGHLHRGPARCGNFRTDSPLTSLGLCNRLHLRLRKVM
eukprot:scaffold106215_cov70-Phaeocystis_antarctica.AAC.6